MKSFGRQTLLLLLLALLGLTSAKVSAQSTETKETAYSLIEDYANILFFAGAQEPAIGYLYYLYDGYPDQQVRTAVPLASWLDLTSRQSEAKDLLKILFTKHAPAKSSYATTSRSSTVAERLMRRTRSLLCSRERY